VTLNNTTNYVLTSTLDAAAAGQNTITSLVDGGTTATLASVAITGAAATTIAGFVDSALTTIDASAATGTVILGDDVVSSVAVAGLTVKAATAGTTSLTSNGIGNTITQATGTGGVTITAANGAGDHITLSNGTNTITAANGAGDHITLGTGANVVTAATGIADVISIGGTANSADAANFAGAADVITLGAGAHMQVTAVGAADTITGSTAVAAQNLVLKIGTVSVVTGDTVTLSDAVASTATSTITDAGLGGNTINTSGWALNGGTLAIDLHLGTTANNVTLGAGQSVTTGAGGDIVNLSQAGNAVTVTASVAGSTTAPVITVLNNAISALDTIVFGNATSFVAAQVDVSTATSLVGALGLATAANTHTTHGITAFQYGGNTYLVDNEVGTAAFAATDVVVELTGLVNTNTATYSTHTLTL